MRIKETLHQLVFPLTNKFTGGILDELCATDQRALLFSLEIEEFNSIKSYIRTMSGGKLPAPPAPRLESVDNLDLSAIFGNADEYVDPLYFKMNAH